MVYDFTKETVDISLGVNVSEYSNNAVSTAPAKESTLEVVKLISLFIGRALGPFFTLRNSTVYEVPPKHQGSQFNQTSTQEIQLPQTVDTLSVSPQVD